jgi:hypothetical protein
MSLTYSASFPHTITISPASTGTSSNFTAGRESDQISNVSNLYDDAMVQGFITVGTTPTANTQINIFVWGSHTAPGTTALDVLDGTDSAETITSVGIMYSMLAIGATLQVDATTSDRKYEIKPFSVAALFGGIMPPHWGIFVSHNTGVNLNSTGSNHELKYVGITW